MIRLVKRDHPGNTWLRISISIQSTVSQLALLRAYAPIFQPLLPASFKYYEESQLTESGVIASPAAKAIADLAKVPARV